MHGHPSKEIIGETSDELSGKKIALGVTGSVSLYRSIDLARALMRRGAEVNVLLTRSAKSMISKDMFLWATGNPVIDRVSGNLEHITVAEENDALVVAPATAKTLAKIASGDGGSIVTLSAMNFMGMRKPVIVVPAMHLQMYISPQVSLAVRRIKEMGVHVIEPSLKKNLAHYPPLDLLEGLITSLLLRGEDMKNARALVTAGPTREYLDPVRFISNPSSGTMGIAIANDITYRGGNATLVAGPLSSHLTPYANKRIDVVTTGEMSEAVEKELKTQNYNLVILSAAPADYRFSSTFGSKIDSRSAVPNISLERTEKIAEKVSRFDVIKVGFSAETVISEEDLIERAKKKMDRYNFDIIVTNNVSNKEIGFKSAYNEVYVITRKSQEIVKIPRNLKEAVARGINDILIKEFKNIFT